MTAHKSKQSPNGYASPACAAADADPAYQGYLSADETVEFLNLLLTAERAGARGVNEMSQVMPLEDQRQALHDIAIDEARFCAMLTKEIARLGAEPTGETGAFYEKLAAEPDLAARTELLNRGQGWVVKRLREALPKIQDRQLYDALKDMLAVHQRNITRCERFEL